MSRRTADEGLMQMQELEDRLSEHTDRLELLRLSARDLRDALSEDTGELQQCLSAHVQWLSHVSERVENLQMNTAVFVQMKPKPRSFKVKAQSSRSPAHRSRAQSELGWSRDSDAASEISCAW